MRCIHGSLAAALLLMSATRVQAQMETSQKVAGGGISVAGWTGKIDANEEKNGQVLNNSKLGKDGDGMRVTTGPAVAY